MSQPFWAGCLIAVAAAITIAGQGSFHAPPRYDGAGYAVLARSLAEGSGYRAIDHPDRPRHAHFPPGYPAFLALVWSVTGPSATAAHVASSLCAVGATLAAWLWFRRLYPREVALLLGLALAVNWAWTRAGSGIQSEPLYELLGQGMILLACRWAERCSDLRSATLGLLLATCFLTRQVALGLALAVLVDLALRRRGREALAIGGTTASFLLPWLAWLGIVGASQRTQASLLLAGSPSFLSRFAYQLRFYIQRIPDQLTGPFVEIATVIRQSPGAAVAGSLWAVAASALVLGGWIMALRRPRRRLAGLIPLFTLGLLLLWPFTEAGRFLIPLIPCLLIGAVQWSSGLLRLVGKKLRIKLTRRRSRQIASVLLLIVSLPYSGYSVLKMQLRPQVDPNRDFDRACAWLVEHGDRPGPILTRHPGEVFLATGRQAIEVSTAERPGEIDASTAAIAESIFRYGVAYLLIDRDRYLMAHESPLERFVSEQPQRVRRIWGSEPEPSATAVYQVLPAP